MPRPKKTDRDLPACVYRKHGAIYLVKAGKWIRLGETVSEAMQAYTKALDTPRDGMPGLLNRWFEDMEFSSPATRKNYFFSVKRLSKIFAKLSPDDVTARDIQVMMHHFRAKPAMANLLRNVLTLSLDFAFLEGVVDRNVARDVRPFKTTARDRYLTDAEFGAIQSKATPTLKVVMSLCYLTGQRIADILAIRYADIGEEGIAFRQQKTKNRLVVAWSSDLRVAVECAKMLHHSVKGLTLLHTRKGTPFSYATIRTLWDRARKAAGVQDAHIHDIRAKAATDANQQGQDSKTLLGHTSESSHRRYLRSKEVPVATPVRPRKKDAA